MCQRTASAICHFKANLDYILFHYIDDFMGLDEPQKAWNTFNTLGNLLRDLGVHESIEKSVQPTTVIEFLGILFDLVRYLLILPQEKLEAIRQELTNWVNRGWATKKQFQSLTGKLQHASLCVRPGRVFVSRLYEKIAEMSDNSVNRITENIKKDLFWWTVFLEKYNGVSIMWMEQIEGEMAFATDTTLQGIGGFYKRLYL